MNPGRRMRLKTKRGLGFQIQVAVTALLALVVGCASVKRWAYEGFNRDSWQKPEQVVRSLGIKPGDYVADLGAGGGYFTFRLSQAVGSSGKVYAVDVDQGMVEYLKQRTVDEGRRNVEVILAEYH